MIYIPESAVATWQEAARELAVEVVAPYVFAVEGREHRCLAFVPHFSGGIIVIGREPPNFRQDPQLNADAKRQGHRVSYVNLELYWKYDRELFTDTLMEWGFTGPEEKRPIWLKESG